MIPGTGGGFGCLEGLLVNRFQRQVHEDIFDLAGGYIVGFNLWDRRTDVSAAIRSLVVRELDESQSGSLISLERSLSHIQRELFGRSRPGPRIFELVADLLKLNLDGFLSSFEGLDLFLQVFHFLAGSLLSQAVCG